MLKYKYKLIAKDIYAEQHEEKINGFFAENPNIEIENIKTWVVQGIGWNTSILYYHVGENNGS